MASHTAGLSEVARRYALALYDLAEEQGQLDRVAGDLKDFGRMIEDSADLRRFLTSPALSREDQAEAMHALATRAEAHPLVGNFLGVVARQRRLHVLPGMIKAFLEHLAARRGEITAEVTSAAPLSEPQTAALKAALKQAMGHDVTVLPKVDPTLLGGLIVQVGSRMVDSSIQSKLARLQLAMKGVG
ncbi:F0F1 ATP synthase subunit delta [Roseospirillum parvum]|uniref:ATP synthase subunit delta n=1 Tax=Roseospirillum parvum TaxID=83401 RepID=A0A1G7UU10_9PROT|nr:F0F1 ATP synthase subunit delta [Roseospirillum parvum]SDG50599.1 F-type H+-transporting ATPase subunit delta [Roseospirillum parvum]